MKVRQFEVMLELSRINAIMKLIEMYSEEYSHSNFPMYDTKYRSNKLRLTIL